VRSDMLVAGVWEYYGISYHVFPLSFDEDSSFFRTNIQGRFVTGLSPLSFTSRTGITTSHFTEREREREGTCLQRTEKVSR
jgi:hypothetical protein